MRSMMLRSLSFIVCVALFLPALSAAETLLVAPQTPATAGDKVTLTLLVLNDDDAPMLYSPPADLPARITADTKIIDLVFTADAVLPAIPLKVGAHDFLKLKYSGRLPADVYGALTIEAPTAAGNKIIVAVNTPTTVQTQIPAVPVPTGGAAITDDFQQRITKAVSGQEPIYFAIGSRGDTNAKFQLSFKYQLSSPNDGEQPAFYHRLYLGYTQTSFWDLEAESKPFEDSVYRPSFFYYDDNIYSSSDNHYGAGYEIGVEHQSNGQSGALSRSLNIYYVRPIIRIGDALDWHWTIAPKIYNYFKKEENPDIADYRGYVDLLIKYGKPRGWEFSSTWRKGTASGKFSMDLMASYPLRHVPFSNLNGYIFAQYFDGYGENMRDYNLRLESQFRIGLMLVR